MMLHLSQNPAEMRALAARLRGYASETCLEMYRRRFQETASELKEAAVADEGAALFRDRPRSVS